MLSRPARARGLKLDKSVYGPLEMPCRAPHGRVD